MLLGVLLIVLLLAYLLGGVGMFLNVFAILVFWPVTLIWLSTL